MSQLFTSRLLLTSDSDLRFYLNKHPSLYKQIDNGKNIINYDELETLQTSFSNTGKYAIVLNTLHSASHSKLVGHWVILLLEITKNTRNCMYIDSLVTSYKSHIHLTDIISRFCAKHKLKLHLWKTRSQRKNTNNCGFQILFYLHHFSNYGLKGMYRLQTMLQQYSLPTKEYYILKKAYKLCKM